MRDNPSFARLTAETTLRAGISGLRMSRARWGETNEGRRSLSRVLPKIYVPYEKSKVKAEKKNYFRDRAPLLQPLVISKWGTVSVGHRSEEMTAMLRGLL